MLFPPNSTVDAQEHSGLLADAPNEIYLIGESGVSLENVRLSTLLTGTDVLVDAFSYGRDFGHHKLAHSFFLWSVDFPLGSEKASLPRTPHFLEPPSECAADLYWARDRRETTRTGAQPHGKAADENNASPVPIDFPNRQFLRIAERLGLDGTYGTPKGTPESDLDGFDPWPPRANGVEDDLYFSIDRSWTFTCGGIPVTVGPADVLLLPGSALPDPCNVEVFHSAVDLGLTVSDDIDALAINRRGDAVIAGVYLSGVVPPTGWYSVTPSSPSLGTELSSGDLFRFTLDETYTSLEEQLHLSCRAIGLCLASDVGTDVDALGHIDPERVHGFVHQGEISTLPDGSFFDGFRGPEPVPGQSFTFGSEFGPFQGSYAVAVDDVQYTMGALDGDVDPSAIPILPADPGGLAVIEFAGETARRDLIDLAFLQFPPDDGAPLPVDALTAQVDQINGTVIFNWQPSAGSSGSQVRVNDGPPQTTNPPHLVTPLDPGAVTIDVRAIGPGGELSEARFAIGDVQSQIDPPEQLELVRFAPGDYDLCWQNPNPLNYGQIEIVLDQQVIAFVQANDIPHVLPVLDPGLHFLELRGIGLVGGQPVATVASALHIFVPIENPPPLPPTGHTEFSPGPLPQVIAADPNLGIGQPGELVLPISVQGGAVVDDVEFILRLEHPQPELLRVTLTSPQGTTLSLVEPLGVTGTVIDRHLDDLGDPSQFDNAGDQGPAESVFLGGPGFATFDGEPVGGTWFLTIENHGSDPGELTVAVLRLLTSVSTESFLRGDANADGALDLSDAMFLLNVIFPDPMAPSVATCTDAIDANDDGTLDISDPIAILHTLFGGGAGLPSPFGVCGPDPTVDSLDCAAFSTCP